MHPLLEKRWLEAEEQRLILAFRAVTNATEDETRTVFGAWPYSCEQIIDAAKWGWDWRSGEAPYPYGSLLIG
jgi:hypothetical protein